MKFEIKCRWTAKVLFECESDSLRIAIEMAVSKRVSLEGAYLKGAYLKGADLEGAYLKGAYLKGAYLEGADLEGAYLKGADLEGAYLKGADLKGAYLKGAYLKGAYLEGADLEGADLEGADLEDIKTDFFGRLSKAKNEVSGLYDALIRGKINGSTYEGECACFCGTIANIRKEDYKNMGIDLRPDSSCATEKWFLAIRKGDTPDNNSVANVTAQWLRDFMSQNQIVIPQYKLVSNVERRELFEAEK